IPEPKPGLVTEAHGGVLFIDEIGEVDINLQSKLLKVLEDKRVFFDSAYYDPNDENTPKYIKKLFETGAPADFILIAATTKSPSSINPAIRSRCTQVYFEPLNPKDIEKIVLEAAKKLKVLLDSAVPAIISEYTIEGRKAINILADAYGLAIYEQAGKGKSGTVRIGIPEIYEVIQTGRLSPYGIIKASHQKETGKIFGLASSGYIGVVIEIEAAVFPRTNGKGHIRFNDSAGSMAKDSVFNAVTAIRRLTGEDLSQYDVHVNIVGGGNVEGPSAGAAVMAALYSAIKGKPLREDIALTGEISLWGKIKPVGGIQEKIYGAKQAGIKKIFIPEANRHDISSTLTGIEVKCVSTIDELMELIFQEE
ncbi:MAG: ATP-dependent protease, Lon family, partial [Firmicutes bacterium HGW-Firmicutes-13]